MSTRISTKQKLLSHLESTDAVLRDILSVLTKRQSSLNLESLVELLLEKDQQLKLTLTEVEAQNELQKKIDVLRSDCIKSDKQINACQLQLKKAEVLLSTALYYSRQKLDTMVKAVKNPVDVDELVRFSHRISATHGVSAPDNWVQGDPRRPYPNREEIRRGYLGHLDDNGHFRPSLWDALSETAAAAATIASTTTPAVGLSGTPCAATGNTPSASTINPPAHSNIPMIPGTSITSHVSGSPTMILPGVNMVSSPLTLSQSNPSGWSSTSAPSSNELLGPSHSIRPPNTSLASMLEPHGRPGLPSRTGVTPLSQSPVGAAPPPTRHGTAGFSKMPNTGHRTNPSLSPGSSAQPQSALHLPPPTYGDPTFGSGPSPKTSLSQTRNSKRKCDDVDTMSTDSSSDSSSGVE
ncbi:hypothetical protein CRM22_003184 [Opisthorchis felineus]|uniref:Mediator of RNA polymerase II transcription subunit 4 n=1 Tax=Opisthorchis felineus TaxID=147828 RepID=A0A4S2M799_OPIFE|nr:hypothetical protein CRM22_003184 [Opisthorchis felineus]